MLQLVGVEYVSPPDLYVTLNDTYDSYIAALNTTEDKNLCNSQKKLSRGQYSLNFDRVLPILICRSLVTVLSNVALALVARRQAKSRDERSQYRRREWNANDVLHLQSIALDMRELGPWKMDGNVLVLTKTARRFKLPWLCEDYEIVDQSLSGENSRVELLPLH